MKRAKKTFLAEVVIKASKPSKLPDFGLGRGVMSSQEITFTDDRGWGFKTPMFALAMLDHERRLVDMAVEVRWTPIKKRRRREKTNTVL